MSNAVSKHHWLVDVARALRLPGAEDLSAAPGDRTPDVWERVTAATGIGDAELAERLAERYVMTIADIGAAEPHAARLLPAIVAVRYHVLPLRYTDRTLDVATCDPHDVDAEREISRLATRAIRWEVAPPAAIREGLGRAYAGARTAAPGREGAASVAPAGNGDGTRRGKEPTHLLVVDDDPETGELLRAFLAGRGFRVSTARSGPEALELLGSDPSIAAVSLDYYMHPVNGLKVLSSIRADRRLRDLPVVMLTSSEDRNIEMSLFEAGADDYVVKPLDPPRFFLRLRAVLRRRTAR